MVTRIQPPSSHTHRCAAALNLSLPPRPLLFCKCFLLVLNPYFVRPSTYRSRSSPPHGTHNRRKSVSPPSWNFSIIPDCTFPSCAILRVNNCHGEKTNDYSGVQLPDNQTTGDNWPRTRVNISSWKTKRIHWKYKHFYFLSNKSRIPHFSRGKLKI